MNIFFQRFFFWARSHFYWLLFLSPFFVGLIYFFGSDFSAWDMEGHLFASRKYMEAIFPYFSGWNKDHFAGYPQGFLYPSLLHWLIGGLAKLISLKVSFLFFVSLSFILLPFSWYYCFRNHGLSTKQLNIAMFFQILLYFSPKNSMGGDVFGTFLIGLVNQQWAMPFFYFFLGSLIKLHEKRNWIFAGFCLGIICLSHAFVLFASILATFGYLLASKDYLYLKKIWVWVKMIALSLVIGAAWWLPYLQYRRWGAGLGLSFLSHLHLWGDENSAQKIYLGIAVFIIYVLFLQYKKRAQLNLLPSFTAPLFFLIITLGFAMIISGIDSILGFPIYNFLPLHLYRLQFFVLSLFFFLLSFGIYDKLSSYTLYLLTLFCCLYGLKYAFMTKKAAFNLGFNFRSDSRVLVYQGPKSLFDFYLPHKLADAISSDHYSTMNGLFVESSKHSGAYFSLFYGMFNYPMTWGVKVLPFNTLLAKDQLKALGINTIVSKTPIYGENRFNLPLEEIAENVRAEIFYNNTKKFEIFHAYTLKNHFAETIEDFAYVEKDWESKIFQWWISLTSIQTTLIKSKDPVSPPTGPTMPSEKLKTIRESDEHFRVYAGTRPQWIKVKESFFPLWKAYSDNKEIPIYLCSPFMMCTYGSGMIEFKFIRGNLEMMSYALTILGLLFCFISYLGKLLVPFIGFTLMIYSSGVGAQKITVSNEAIGMGTGAYHTCIHRKEKVFCWGYNHFSQLGNGLQESQAFMVKAEHTLSKVEGLSLGAFHTCVWNREDVQCVGNNIDHQLDKSDTLSFKNFISVIPFFSMKNFLILDVKSFGNNLCVYGTDQKQHFVLNCSGGLWKSLGFKHSYSLNGPIESLSVGESHVCYVQNQTVHCSGSTKFGATTLQKDSYDKFEKILGIGPRTYSARSVSSGAVHSCGVFYDLKKKKDAIFCWGDNSISQLGVDNQKTPGIVFSPQLVEGGSQIIKDKVSILRSGYSHSCAVIDKKLFCWGSNLKREISPLRLKLEYPFMVREAPFDQVENVFLGVHYTCAMGVSRFSCQGVQGNGAPARR